MGNVDISELSQYVSESVERDSVQRSLRESKLKIRMTNCVVLFMDFKKPSSLPSDHLAPSQQTGSEGLRSLQVSLGLKRCHIKVLCKGFHP